MLLRDGRHNDYRGLDTLQSENRRHATGLTDTFRLSCKQDVDGFVAWNTARCKAHETKQLRLDCGPEYRGRNSAIFVLFPEIRTLTHVEGSLLELWIDLVIVPIIRVLTPQESLIRATRHRSCSWSEN